MTAPGDEGLLSDVASGERRPDDQEVAARRAADEGFARRLDELLAARALLERDAAEESEGVAAVTDDDVATARDVFARLAAGAARDAGRPGGLDGGSAGRGPSTPPRAAAGRRGRRAWLLVAAAVLVAVVLHLVTREAPGDPWTDLRGIPLGPDAGVAPVAISPRGAVDAFGRFAVALSLPEGARCRLRIWDGDVDGPSRAVVDRRLDGTSWTPTRAERRALPDRLRWEVVVEATDGQVLGVVRERAWRR